MFYFIGLLNAHINVSGERGGGVAGISWGLDCQNSHCHREFDRRLWHRGGTGILGIKLCHVSSESDLNFSKLSNSQG